MEINDNLTQVPPKTELILYSRKEVKDILHAHGVIEVDNEVFENKGVNIVEMFSVMMVETRWGEVQKDLKKSLENQ